MRKNQFKKIILGTFLSVIGLLFSVSALAATTTSDGTYDAQTFKDKSGLNTTAGVGGYDVNSSTTPEQIIGQAVFTALSLIGVIFLILLIYGGFIWMTAMGNEEKVKKANEILMGSIFGLIIVLSAYVISYFLIKRIGG